MALSIHGSDWIEHFLILFKGTVEIPANPVFFSGQLIRKALRGAYLLAVITLFDSATAVAQEALIAFGIQNPHPVESGYAPRNSGSDLWSVSAVLTMDNENIIAVQSGFLRLPITNSTSLGERASGKSDWSFTHLYAGVQSITDVANATFHSSTAVSRDALGLAGSEPVPGGVHVWLHGDKLIMRPGDQCLTSAILRSTVNAINTSLELSGDTCEFIPLAESQETLATFIQQYNQINGQINGVNVHSGTAWLQRSWGPELGVAGLTSSGEAAPVVSDQFRLKIPGKQFLSLWQTRRRDGSGTPVLSAMLFSDTTAESVDYRKLKLEDIKQWSSGTSGNRYASAWRLRLPELLGAQSEIVIRAVVPDQEVDVGGEARWMGLVSAEWEVDGDPFMTYGFAELAPIAKGVSH